MAACASLLKRLSVIASVCVKYCAIDDALLAFCNVPPDAMVTLALLITVCWSNSTRMLSYGVAVPVSLNVAVGAWRYIFKAKKAGENNANTSGRR